MPRTKKSVTTIADFPIVETPVKTRKPRASRSKAAVAARVNEAIANKQFDKLSDAKLAKAGIRIVSFFDQSAAEVLPVDVAAAKPEAAAKGKVEGKLYYEDGISAFAAGAVGKSITGSDFEVVAIEGGVVDLVFSPPTAPDFDTVMQRLTAVEHGWSIEPVADHPALILDATHPATDDEIDAAIAALEAPVDGDDPEVVRSLADVDVGAMYAEETAPEEAAFARYIRANSRVVPFGQLPTTDAERALIDSIPHEFGKLIQTISIAERLADMNDDSALPMIEKEYALDDRTADGSTFAVVGSQAVIDLIDRLLPDVEAELPTINCSAVQFSQFGDLSKLSTSDDTYTTLTAQYDKILALEGELIDAKAEVQRAEIVAREALRNGTEKSAIIAHQDTVIADLNSQLKEANDEVAKLDRAEFAANVRKYLAPAILLKPAVAGEFQKGTGAMHIEIVDMIASDFVEPVEGDGSTLIKLFRGRGHYYAPIIAGSSINELTTALGGTKHDAQSTRISVLERRLSDAQVENASYRERGIWARLLNRPA